MAESDRYNPSSAIGWLILALAGVTGYAVWQIAPLDARIEALEQTQAATRDELLGELDRVSMQLEAMRQRPERSAKAAAAEPVAPSQSAAANPPPPDTPRPAPTAPSAAAPAEAPRVALEFLDQHLFPADAVIARLMAGNVPPDNIARLTNHSKAYVIARGMQIEKLVGGAPNAPPEVTGALRRWTRDHAPR